MASLPRSLRTSLALRLALLYAAGTTLLLLAIGVGLAMLLRTQLEARDREEIDGKTEHVLRVLRELRSSDGIEGELARIEDIALDHPHLSIGLRLGGRWLVPLAPDLAALVGTDGNDAIPHAPQLAQFEVGPDIWWLRRVDFVAPGDVVFSAYVGVHVDPTQQLVRALLATMTGAGVLGVLASALLGGWVARRGLAPVTLIAREAERVTADRLGEPLPAHDAPAEVRGLVNAINNLMLQTQVTLARPRSADEYREALHSNLAELERLQRMVADMLFLARADKGMFEIKPEPVDLAKEAAGVAEFFEAAAAERQQRIAVEGEAAAPGDRAMLRRAITNLLSNAVRYAPTGARIRVRAAQTPAAARLEVENPAPPLSPDELQRLFKRFNRGGARRDDGDGAGLGLSIVESIMRLHGGRIEAASGDFGLRFALVFPRLEGTGAQDAATGSAGQGALPYGHTTQRSPAA